MLSLTYKIKKRKTMITEKKIIQYVEAKNIDKLEQYLEEGGDPNLSWWDEKAKMTCYLLEEAYLKEVYNYEPSYGSNDFRMTEMLLEYGANMRNLEHFLFKKQPPPDTLLREKIDCTINALNEVLNMLKIKRNNV